jgi:hypothetical protein
MAMQEIEIIVDEQGNVQVEAKGFSGADCKTLTKAIEEAVGEVTDVKLKPGYRQTRNVTRTASR